MTNSTEPQKAERDAFEKRMLDIHNLPITRDSWGRYEIYTVAIAWEESQAAFEAGRSAREQELREAAQAVLDDAKWPAIKSDDPYQYEKLERLQGALKEHS